MNERIRELAEQANEKIRYRIDPNTFKHIDDSNGPHTRFEFNKEKFAESIVKKCISMADEFEMDVNRSGLVDKMKEYFGVEE